MKTAFLSSTGRDLADFREAAYRAIQGLDGWKCIRMEDFGARDRTPDEFCRARVAECDVFVGLVGHLYGSSPPGEELSFTEREYRAAVSARRPRFVFVAHDDFVLPASLRESDALRQKQDAFRECVSREHIRDTFDSPKDLAARVVLALSNWQYRPETSMANEFTVRLVADFADPDVRSALDLYEERIPDQEKFEAPDIIRWLREDQEQRSSGIVGPRDYFVVAKLNGKVCGFTLLHYYPVVQLAFIAYLVAERGVVIDHGSISQRLLEKVAWVFANEEYLRQCKGFLLEVDDPVGSPDERREKLARIRLFCMLAESLGFSLRGLRFDYRQPLLWIPGPDEIGVEMPMVLMYARKAPFEDGNSFLPRAEVARLLEFVYKWLYPEGFSDVANENVRYRKYLDQFYADQIAKLPDEVPLLPFHDIKARSNQSISPGRQPSSTL